jgi:chaperonin GroEL
VAAVVKDIERHARKVQSSDEIAQVGTISANDDRAIGKGQAVGVVAAAVGG